MDLKPMNCTRCKGEGTVPEHWDGEHYQEQPVGRKLCVYCRGKKTFDPPDVPAILQAIKGRKGLRSSMTFEMSRGNPRAYYVWRLARFHGGKDVTMPMTACILIEGDPFHDLLDKIAELVAKKAFGTDMAAAYRWAGALGHSVSVPDGMPASAYSSGPTYDSNKPDFELLETK